MCRRNETHTHTHTDENISQIVDIPEYADDNHSQASEDQGTSSTEGDEYIEESDSESSEESDCE